MFQILVVEDDKELCDLFCTVLTDNGYTAVPAADGLAAFDRDYATVTELWRDEYAVYGGGSRIGATAFVLY